MATAKHLYIEPPPGDSDDWWDRARCRGMWDEVDFFGADARPARLLCTACPVSNPCLLWAIHNDEKGIWGGTSERDRDKIKRYLARPQTRPPTCQCGWQWTVWVGSSKSGKVRCLRCAWVWETKVGLAAVQGGGG